MSRILIHNVSVFDGEQAIGPRDVLIDGQYISRVEPNIDSSDAEVIDGQGKTLLPGLIDSHVHVYRDALHEALAFGVTTVLDMFMDVATANGFRIEQASPVPNRAHLVSAGNIATAPGGHGTQYGVKVATLTRPNEADAFVAARCEEGSDYIKIIWESGDGTWPTLDEETVGAVIDAAHRFDKLAVIHITDQAHARRSIELGVDGLAHIFGDREPEDDFADLVASRGAFVIPTLSVIASVCGVASGATLLEDDGLLALMTPEQRLSLARASGWGRGRRKYRFAVMAVEQLHAAGVPILAGTDAPNLGTTHGASMHRELQLLTECGMTPTQALASATALPAKLFGLPERGRIAPGAIADLLLVNGAPTLRLEDTMRIVGVFKDGVRFDHGARRQEIIKLIAESSIPAPAPDAAALADGTISDFSEGLTTRFGTGWATTSDAVMGGTSSVQLDRAEQGFKAPGALLIEGEVGEGYLFPWAGANFGPGAEPMAPADLSSKEGFAFYARGDGGEYRAGVMATSLGFIPSTQGFVAGEEWARHEVTFESLGIDGTDVTAIVFMCSQKRPFRLEVDEVLLI